jgi:hypothetical protein
VTAASSPFASSSNAKARCKNASNALNGPFVAKLRHPGGTGAVKKLLPVVMSLVMT